MKKLTTVLLLIAVFSLSAAAAHAGDPRNQPPVANDDTVIVRYEPPYVDIRVLENDYDPEGAPLTVVGVPSMVGGKAVIVKGQVVRVYLPPPMSAPDYVPPIYLLAEGTYLVSDGANVSMAEWRVFLSPQ
ncbi:MAG TPA: Ig-like domain-containing protein [Anaerolineae bacterium]|nr:Ig-like domain-containing protein [Anaerolineae bacterium]